RRHCCRPRTRPAMIRCCLSPTPEPVCAPGGRPISADPGRPIDPRPLLHPRSVAVRGASDRPSPGRMIIESLDRIGFRGPLYPINPKHQTLFGRPCYPSIDDLPEAVDILAVCVNHTRVIEHMRPAPPRRLRAAIISPP